MAIPPINPQIVIAVREAAKKLFPLFLGWVTNKISEISEERPLTDNSTAAEMQRVQKVLTEIQQYVQQQTEEVEKELIKEVEEYFNQLTFALQSNPEWRTKYKIPLPKYEREINRIQRNIQGFLSREVSDEISLLNPTMHHILQLPPGQKKEDALQQFMRDTLKQSMDRFVTYFEDEIANLATLIEEDVQEKIENVQQRQKELLEQFQKLESTYNQGNEQKEQVQLDASEQLMLTQSLQKLWETNIRS